jgi:hypothetical protein
MRASAGRCADRGARARAARGWTVTRIRANQRKSSRMSQASPKPAPHASTSSTDLISNPAPRGFTTNRPSPTPNEIRSRRSLPTVTTQRGSSGLASEHDDRLIRSDAHSHVTPAASTSLVPAPGSSGARGLAGNGRVLRARGGHPISASPSSPHAPGAIRDPTWVVWSCQCVRRSTHSIGCPQPADSRSLDELVPRPRAERRAWRGPGTSARPRGASTSASSHPRHRLAPSATQRGSPGVASEHDDRLIRSDALSR